MSCQIGAIIVATAANKAAVNTQLSAIFGWTGETVHRELLDVGNNVTHYGGHVYLTQGEYALLKILDALDPVWQCQLACVQSFEGFIAALGLHVAPSVF